MYVALFLCALLFLFLTRNSKKCLYYYCTLFSVLVLFPPTARLLGIYFQQFYDRQQLYWFLPVTGVLAAAVVCLYDRVKSISMRRVLMPVLCIIMLLCGGITGYSKYQAAQVEEKEEYEEVLTRLVQTADAERDILLVAPEELMERARLFDARILTVYGRDLWENDLNAYFYDGYDPKVYSLYENMKEPISSYPVSILTQIQDLGVSHVVFNKENLTFDENLDYPQIIKAGQGATLEKIGETYHYVIYQVQG